MLTLELPEREYFHEGTSTFVTEPGLVLKLEHSLAAVSKWEAEHGRAFLSNNGLTSEEMLDYIRCMIVSPEDVAVEDLQMSEDNLEQISDYINSLRTATHFNDLDEGSGPKETVTSELVYYWMLANNIPFECQYWHINRLFALIRICGMKNSPPKKLNAQTVAKRQHDLNEQRRKMLATKG